MDVLHAFYPEITAFLFTALSLYFAPFLGFCLLTVILSYYAARLLWKVDSTCILSMLIKSLRPIAVSTDYSEVYRELAVVKDKIKENHIHSWSRPIKLYDLSEYSLELTADVAIDRVSYLLSMKRIQSYDIITDLLKAVTSHVTACRSVRLGNRDNSATSSFTPDLRASLISDCTTEWDETHSCPPHQYLYHLSNQILGKLVPEERNPIIRSLLCGIFSENVLTALLEYLSQQRNLLKIVILVLSDDSDQILKSAEICSSNSVAPHTLSSSSLANDQDGTELHKEMSPEFSADASVGEAQSLDITSDTGSQLQRRSSPEILSHSSDEESDYQPVFSDSQPSSDEIPDNSEQYVSSDLNKFLKLAPPTPVREMPPIGQQLQDTEKISFASPVLMPAITLTDSSGSVTTSCASGVNNSDSSGSASKTVRILPAMVMQPASVIRPNSLTKDPSLDGDAAETVSNDSGLSSDLVGSHQLESTTSTQLDVGYTVNNTEKIAHPGSEQKFVSITIQDTERKSERRQSGASYTLYVIRYQATYVDEWGETDVKSRKVYRRWREFVNLAARLDKTHSKRLRRIDGPKWWQQISLRALKHGDIQKRKRQLSIFLRQLIADPVFNANKDVEEFLAYNGGGEIEFVQEKVEFIPPAVRLDKMVFRTVSGVVGKVTDKLAPTPTLPHSSSTDDSNVELGNHIKRLHHSNKVVIPQVAISEHYQPAGLLHTGENDLHSTIKRISPEYQSVSNWEKTLNKRDNHHATVETVASDIIELVLYLLQGHRDLYKLPKLTSMAYSTLLPILELWLQRKITQYTQPDQLTKFLRLFHETLWPGEEKDAPQYDLEKLRSLAVETILTEVPSIAVMVIGRDIQSLLDEVLSLTADTEVNTQLVYCLLDHLLCNSCSVFE